MPPPTLPTSPRVKTTPPIHILATTSSGERVRLHLQRTARQFRAERLHTWSAPATAEPAITKSRSWTSDISPTPQLTKTETRPYFYRDNIEQPVYKLSNPALRNAPATPPALRAWVNLTFEGVDLKIGRVVHSGPQPVQIIPPVSVNLSQSAQVITLSAKSVPIWVTVHPAADVTSISATTVLHAGKKRRQTRSPLVAGIGPGVTSESIMDSHLSRSSISPIDSTEPRTVKVSAHTRASTQPSPSQETLVSATPKASAPSATAPSRAPTSTHPRPSASSPSTSGSHPRTSAASATSPAPATTSPPLSPPSASRPPSSRSPT